MNSHIEGSECRCTRLIRAPRERVFAAFSDGTQLARWWGPAGFTNTFEVFDFRVGGAWKFVMHSAEGKNFENESVFAEIAAPERIVVHHVSPPKFVLTVTFEAIDGNTQVHWRQQFESAEMCARLAPIIVPANEQNLDRLQAVVER